MRESKWDGGTHVHIMRNGEMSACEIRRERERELVRFTMKHGEGVVLADDGRRLLAHGRDALGLPRQHERLVELIEADERRRELYLEVHAALALIYVPRLERRRERSQHHR